MLTAFTYDDVENRVNYFSSKKAIAKRSRIRKNLEPSVQQSQGYAPWLSLSRDEEG
jgi:hypothetical protein